MNYPRHRHVCFDARATLQGALDDVTVRQAVEGDA